MASRRRIQRSDALRERQEYVRERFTRVARLRASIKGDLHGSGRFRQIGLENNLEIRCRNVCGLSEATMLADLRSGARAEQEKNSVIACAVAIAGGSRSRLECRQPGEQRRKRLANTAGGARRASPTHETSRPRSDGAGQGVPAATESIPGTRPSIPSHTRTRRSSSPGVAKIQSMTRRSSSSRVVGNCMPRGVPAIWLQNPYTTYMVHKPGLLVQLYEVLNNWRLLHLDGRPIPKDPEPFFHGNSTARWEGETLVVESTGFDERTYIQPNGWFHSDALKVTERYTRPSMNYLIVEVTVDDPKVLEKPWKSAPRRWTLGNGEIYEFYCTNNLELEELEKLRQQELKQK